MKDINKVYEQYQWYMEHITVLDILIQQDLLDESIPINTIKPTSKTKKF